MSHLDCTGLDLQRHPLSRPALKKALPVSVAFAREGGVEETLEGPVPYVAGDAVLTGPAGEKWPVKREVFNVVYDPLPGTASGRDGLYLKKPLVVSALRIYEEFRVRTGGFELAGRPGDWLVQYAPENYGIVSAEVFEATYALGDGQLEAASSGQ